MTLTVRILTAYGGLLPIATMLEKLGFQQRVEETLTAKRATRVMSMYQFVLAMVLALYVGFARLAHVQFLKREPMLIGILKVLGLPPQCTFWRFLASLHLSAAGQLLQIQRRMRQRVWEAAHVKLHEVTLDTDTTVHTRFGHQMEFAKLTTPRTEARRAISRSSRFWRRRGSPWAASFAMALARPASRSPVIWKVYLRLCRKRCRRFGRGPTPAFTAGKRWKPTCSITPSTRP